VMKWLHVYLKHNQKKKHVETQVKFRPLATLGNTMDTDWDERE